MYSASTLYPARWDLLFRYLWSFFSPGVLWFVRYLPGPEYRRFRRYQEFIVEYGRELMLQARARNVKGTGKDIISILLRANEAEEARLKLSDKEVVDQISYVAYCFASDRVPAHIDYRVLLLAGHETTASSLSWWFYEMARQPEWQQRVRDEIRATRRLITERGDTDFSVGDLDGLSVMHATLKEAMRLHPIVWLLSRTAERDDVIPLATPITSKSGASISVIPVRKGQNVEISISAYNRQEDSDSAWTT